MPMLHTLDEYLDLVDQTLFEIDDVLLCAEDEGDPEDQEFSDILPVYQHLSQELKKLHADLVQGKQSVGQGQDLPFTPLVLKWKDRIPFHDLLTAINYAYKTGF